MAEHEKDSKHESGGKHSKKHGGHGHGSGGGGHEGEHEGAPEWLISFADNVALLMGFFVILLAMNMKEPTAGGIGGKEEHGGSPDSNLMDMVISIRQAFNNPVSMDSTDPRDQPMVRRMKERLRNQSQSDEQGPPGEDQDVESIRPGDHFNLGGTVPFELASATISTPARETIARVAEQIRGRRFIIDVRGHVSAAEAFGREDKGMGLSYNRALAVAEELARAGVEWGLLRIVACGDNDRIMPLAYDSAGHRTNQRVEVIVTERVAPGDPHAGDPEGAPRRAGVE